MKAHNGMKSQDIAVLLFICAQDDGNWKVFDLASSLNISQSEISESLNRSKIARLIDKNKKVVFRNNLLEFIQGNPYIEFRVFVRMHWCLRYW